MLYIHTIGRIGKDCQVIEGTHGSFIAFDMAVDDFSHGNAVTTWVRVRSNKENHIRLSEYLTKGRMVLVGGTLSTSLWKDKNGDSQMDEAVQKAVQKLIDDGTYLKILKYWGVEDGAIETSEINTPGAE